MKTFECGSLVPGCQWHTEADEEAEAVRRAVEHIRLAHDEPRIRETMVEAIKASIHDRKAA